jgi:large repetitive protein
VSPVQTLAWDMDFTPPTISFGLISPAATSFINSNNFSAEIVTDEATEIHAAVNGSDLGVVSSPVALNNLADGAYHLEVYGIDHVGNVTNTISHDFTVDTSAPTVSLSAAVTGVTNTDSNTLTFSADQAAIFECNIDGAGFASCDSPMALTGLAEGEHTAEVRALDEAGNVSGIVYTSWTVDTVAPISTILANQTSANSITFTLVAYETGVTFLCSLDGAAPSSCTSPISYSGLAEGSHTFRAFATDLAGNTETSGSFHAFETRPPVTTTLVTTTPSANYNNSTTISFAFTSNHPDATFKCQLDGGAAVPCISPMNYSGLLTGAHTFKVQAVDMFGAADPLGASYSWTVDLVNPTMVTVGTSVTSTSITVTWQTSELCTTKLNWGKDTALDKVVPEDSVYKTTHQVKLTGLTANTTYSLQPAGTDRAGNAFTATRFTVRTAR